MNALEEENQLIRGVFNTPQGRKLLDILANQYVYSTATSPDTNMMYYHTGARDLVMHLLLGFGELEND